MAQGTRIATSTLKPSTATAPSTAVNGPCEVTSAHCQRAKPRAVREMTTVPAVATVTRSGRRTSEETARRSTAPPNMTISGMIAR